jgi:hypothetical protein
VKTHPFTNMSTSNTESTATTTALPTPTTSELKHTIAAHTQPLPPAHVFQATPSSSSSSTLLPTHPSYKAHGDIPNTPFAVSLISTMLGGIFFTSLTLALLGLTGTTSEALAGAEAAAGWGNWARPRLGGTRIVYRWMVSLQLCSLLSSSFGLRLLWARSFSMTDFETVCRCVGL